MVWQNSKSLHQIYSDYPLAKRNFKRLMDFSSESSYEFPWAFWISKDIWHSFELFLKILANFFIVMSFISMSILISDKIHSSVNIFQIYFYI